MKRRGSFLFLVLLLALLPLVLASASGSFDLSWWSVDGGGGKSDDGVFSLQGFAGQADAGRMQGGVFSLAGGFLGGAAQAHPQRSIFLPLVVRSK